MTSSEPSVPCSLPQGLYCPLGRLLKVAGCPACHYTRRYLCKQRLDPETLAGYNNLHLQPALGQQAEHKAHCCYKKGLQR